MKKLSFTIDNAELVDDNPRSSFAVLSLDFFSSGKNRHDTFIKEDVLRKKANTIYNVPILWKYDKSLDDASSHAPDQVPCGFVPFGAEIKEKKLVDGRIMLNTTAYVWKKYSGRLLEIFMRDKSKAISVEMSVFDIIETDDGLISLEDYAFEGITVLGTFVTPAIPNATSSVVKFSAAEETKEYNKAYMAEFSSKYDELDFTIPEKVRENAKEGLDLHKKHGGGTSVSLSLARYLLKNEKADSGKVKQIYKHFSRNMEEPATKNTKEWSSWQQWGGTAGFSWSKKLIGFMNRIDERKLSYFAQEGEEDMPYKSLKDINPALKGIEPPITLAQANAIAKQADAIGTDKKVNGWAVAISSFKKTHKVVDGKWVKKDEKMAEETEDKETMSEEIKKPDEEMALPPEEGKPMPDVMAETPAEEQEEKKEEQEEKKEEEEEKKEEQEEKKEGFSFAEFASNLIAYMEEEVGEDEEFAKMKMAADELKKQEGADFGVIAKGMYAKMCKMASKISQMAEESKTYMTELASLKEFKAGIEAEQKKFAVEQTIHELEEKVVFPEGAREQMLADSQNYSLEQLDIWKNACKAKSFDFATKSTDGKEIEIKKYDLPFHGNSTQNSLWTKK